MNHLNVFPITEMRDQKLYAHYFVQGIHGNYLFGNGHLIEESSFESIKSRGGLKAVLNLAEMHEKTMEILFNRFGCKEVRADEKSSSSYPTAQYGVDYQVPEISLLSTSQLNHFLLTQKKRKILFLDSKIEMMNHQLISHADPIELTQGILDEIENIDFLACFSSLGGGTFCPLLPGLLQKKIDGMVKD